MFSTLSLAFTALAAANGAFAGFSSGSKRNVAVYWGQNSYGQGSGDLAQQRLSYYCANTDIDIVPIAFLTVINGQGGQPEINFSNAGDRCSTFDGTSLLNCPEIAEDITTCQSQYGKTVILSIGGATYSEGGFSSTDAAVAGANKVWATFGPDTGFGALRPFGSASVDGFDFDFEASVSNMAPFAQQLRTLMDGAGSSSGRKFILTAAPQCPYPDAADKEILENVAMDAVMVQFYNNYCGVNSYVDGAASQNNFNFNAWDNWAKTVSKNPEIKVLLGVPANTGAGAGYVADLNGVISYSSQYSSFGGVMMWDASQAEANSGFVGGVKGDLGSLSRTMKYGFRNNGTAAA
ncbi:glycoside hydrolase family 18 protein [Aulographum hederae CBS 113979]|uniref:chitinase n=1 Tax=Aulographum hederae CBS 113979 TaxID=1176131 RepID=A0A6G1HBX7_9PEZI|nr:glycoside hydrolase family 18 protein [Aulographum hederae CBS 113979]